jgi:hypothetical protein
MKLMVLNFCLGKLNVDIKLKKMIPVFALCMRHCVHYESCFDFFDNMTVTTYLDLSLM